MVPQLSELRIARMRRGISGDAVAQEIGVTPDAYYKMERNVPKIAPNKAAAITRALGLSFYEFVAAFGDGRVMVVEKEGGEYRYRDSRYPLCEARLDSEASAKQLAEAIGKDGQSPEERLSRFRRIEKGKGRLTIGECCVLSREMGLSIEEFNDVFFKIELPFRNEDVHLYNQIIQLIGGEINAKEGYESC